MFIYFERRNIHENVDDYLDGLEIRRYDRCSISLMQKMPIL